MRTRNARPLDALESAYVADAKQVGCVVCSKRPNEAHHEYQGLHFVVVAVCTEHHSGPAGIHGDGSAFRTAKLTIPRAINETFRRVMKFRNGEPINADERPQQIRKRGGSLSSSKILPRRAA